MRGSFFPLSSTLGIPISTGLVKTAFSSGDFDFVLVTSMLPVGLSKTDDCEYGIIKQVLRISLELDSVGNNSEPFDFLLSGEVISGDLGFSLERQISFAFSILFSMREANFSICVLTSPCFGDHRVIL